MARRIICQFKKRGSGKSSKGGGTKSQSKRTQEKALQSVLKDCRTNTFNGNCKIYAIDDTKVRSLGYEPRWNLEEGLRHTVEWYRDNESWWKRVKSGEFAQYYQKQYEQRGKGGESQ